VHLWIAELTTVPETMRTALSADEWMRSSRFHFAADRRRYVSTRAIVREILAGYTDADPASLQFACGPHGKPALRKIAPFLRFNLSHSDDLMLLAVTFAREIGVDVEAMRSQVHYEMLAEHYFSPEEQWALRITPPARRHRKFFELWTRNEARLKAYGTGLGDLTECSNSEPLLTVQSFEPAEGYAAAVAIEGDTLDMTCWRWQN
jgi:4'-phosphopantetheinyl transferase